jgi:hypothetical protein
MNTNELHSKIHKALLTDLEALKGISTANSKSPGRWSWDDTGLLCLDDRIYVSHIRGSSDVLKINVLQNNHDHILAGHFGQNRTLDLVRQTYVWPELQSFVRSWCQSCMHCKRNKKLVISVHTISEFRYELY